MRLYAPAKINWTLEVLGRREDGYQEIRSVMQTVDLSDTLEIERGGSVRIEVEGAGELSDDLLVRAAELLDEGSGRGASVRVEKRIPAPAGLGGGSSDAAAALRALNELWGLGLSRDRLADLAARIGSDVPFFLYGGTALAEGRGERVTPLGDARQGWLVLAVPDIRMEDKTKRMYAALTPADLSDGSRTEALVGRIREGRPLEDGSLCNAFERAAYETFEGLEQYRRGLLAAGARRVHLAGSGPALFALALGEDEARSLHERLRLPGGRAFVVRTLTAAEALRREG